MTTKLGPIALDQIRLRTESWTEQGLSFGAKALYTVFYFVLCGNSNVLALW